MEGRWEGLLYRPPTPYHSSRRADDRPPPVSPERLLYQPMPMRSALRSALHCGGRAHHRPSLFFYKILLFSLYIHPLPITFNHPSTFHHPSSHSTLPLSRKWIPATLPNYLAMKAHTRVEPKFLPIPNLHHLSKIPTSTKFSVATYSAEDSLIS